MYITPSDELKAAAVNPSGNIPMSLIEVWPVSGVISESKGLKREIADGFAHGPAWDDDKVLWEDRSTIMAFNWGDALPLGITEPMLTDGKTWSMKWSGYFLCKRPEGYTGHITYQFGYTGAGCVLVYVDGVLWTGSDTHDVFYGPSPHSINESKTRLAQPNDWVPLSVYYLRADATVSNRQLKNERFVLFWKDSIDDEWRVMGSDVTCPPGGRFVNLIGGSVADISAPGLLPSERLYLLNIHKVGATYHFHIRDGATEFDIHPGDTEEYHLNPGVAGGDSVWITWSDTISHNDQVEIYLVSGAEDPYILSSVSGIQIDSSLAGASKLHLKVPITRVPYDSANVTRDNQCTYDLATDSFGVLRKGRMVTASLGYQVASQPSLIKRFTGVIEDISPEHTANPDGSSTWLLEVLCIDARTFALGTPVTGIEDLPMGGLPNDLSYDIAGIFPESTLKTGPDGDVRPHAYDRWNLATMVRSVLYQRGFTSSQLWAKDDNGNFLIEDRNIFLEHSPAYPFSSISHIGARAVADEDIATVVKPHVTYDISIDTETGVQTVVGEYKSSYTENLKQWAEYADTQGFPYLFQFKVDTEPWKGLLDICHSYGLELGVNTDGNVYMRYPDNPEIYDVRASVDDDPDNYINVKASNGFYYEADPYSIGNEILISTLNDGSSDGAVLSIAFTGVGIKLIFPRMALGGTRASVAIDDPDLFVGGIAESTGSLNILDRETGDTGHPEWVDFVDNHKGDSVDFYMAKTFLGRNRWYYSDGVHPGIGKNPCVYTICDNLTYGPHIAYVKVYGASVVRFEGFMPITRSVQHPIHEFNSYGMSSISVEESAPSLVNDVIVVGSQSGAAGDNIISRGVDLGSIGDEDSANYTGRRKTWLISSPKIINQERADYLAQHIIQRYRSGYRNIQLESMGLPWLEPGDPIEIRDITDIAGGTHPLLGMYSPDDLTKEQRSGSVYEGVMSVPFQRYWVTEISEDRSAGQDSSSYTTAVNATSLPPLPAYEPLPEPDQAQFDYSITELNIEHDGVNYNPYLSDKEGKYVDVSFNLNWHSSYLVVRVVCGQHIVQDGKDDLLPGQTVNILVSRIGFVPAGEYRFAWDGWLAIDQDTGYYATDGDYYIEIDTNRYSTNAGFLCRSDSGLTDLLASGSKDHISVEQDFSIYAVPRYTAVVSPFVSGTHNHANPPIVYDDTNNGHGVKIEVTLNCSARVEFTVRVKHLFFHFTDLPENNDSSAFPVLEEFYVMARGEESPILDPGNYTFYFSPLADMILDNRPIAFMHYNRKLGGAFIAEDWYQCFHCQIGHQVKFVDKAGKVGILEGTDDSGVYAKATYMVDTTKNFVVLGVEVDRVVRNKNDGSHALITSISTEINSNDRINFSGGLSGGTDNVFDSGDVYSVEGVMDTTIADAFPAGYEFLWGGATAGLYDTVERYDKNSYYTFFKVKG